MKRAAAVWIVLAAAAASTVRSAPAAALSAKGRRLLFIMNVTEVEKVKAEVPYNAALVKQKEEVLVDDRRTADHLREIGFTVTTGDESAPVEAAKGQDVVVISESVDAYPIGDRYTYLPVAVVCWENDLYDDLRMTGKRLNVDYGTNRTTKTAALRLVNAPHPLSAGLAGGMHTVFTEPKELNWGRPGLGAAIIATVPGEPEKVATFAYEKGATMDYDFIAPARRVGLFPWQNEVGALSAEGRALFDAAMIWAASPPEE
jgi:hypothetical protein